MTTKTHSSANPMWGGRFDGGVDTLMEEINASIHIDKTFYKEDIAGSKAHAEMLATKGILSAADKDAIIKGLSQIEEEITAGQMAFTPALEDIHMHVESRLKELIGDAAGRLHTARSRNDQVATDFRLWVRGQYDQLLPLVRQLQSTLVTLAESHHDTIMPGYTHLQTAQPVTFGHYLMAYMHMLDRDYSRLHDARTRMNECPLGAAALAGTSFPIDRHQTATTLKFDRPMANSMDAVSDRDFALEFLSVAAICITHLSRMAEELVIFTSADLKFVTLPTSFTSGSSIMPQKRNPDAAELVRAKTGRVFGNLISLLTVMKGLPLTYSKDMQEDKEPVFDSAYTLTLALKVMDGMMSGITVHKERMKQAANYGYSTATDIADWLVREKRIPFRDAHHITGSVVKYAESKQKQLEDLSEAELQAISPLLDGSLLSLLSVEQSVKSRNSFGGTAPQSVIDQISAWRKKS